MSDEMMVQQNQRPSAVPYFLAGAAVGGGLGAVSPWGVTKPRYSSFDDIIAEKEDSFKKAKDKAKDDDVKKAFEKVETEKKTFKEAEKAANQKIEELTKANTVWAPELTGNTDAKALIDEITAAEGNAANAKNELLNDVKSKITAGELEVPGMKAEESKKLTGDELTKKAEEMISKNKDKVKEKCKDKVEALQTAENTVKEKTTALEKKAGELNVPKDKIRALTEDGKKLVEAAKKGITDAKENGAKAVKEAMEKIKMPNRWANGLILGGALAILLTLLRPKAKDNA